MERFWNCLVEGTDGGKHFKHFDFKDTQIEAERLARLPSNVGRKVFMLEATGYYRVSESSVEWHVF